MDHVVIGTAGHIDHGKTALVKALTGVDTDRLLEEKTRGITIDIGFAPLDLGEVKASIVDVPGHEAFIRNMLAGATGIDAALLVVAADEGVMPQTREHWLILQSLGLTRGVVALSKSDLADQDWRGLVAEDVRALTGWPVVEVSAKAGSGLEDLRAALRAAARGVTPREQRGLFRMPVDRVFTLPGTGTVVTGTTWSGTIAEGEAVTLLPGGIVARVRSVQVHGRAAPAAVAGRRTALALAGAERALVSRGSVAVAGGPWRASAAADVLATFVAGPPRLRSRIHLHHGTSEIVARVARIGDAAAGGIPLRLMLDTPLVLARGDRMVLRSWSPVTTIGGAVVTDPWADRIDRAWRRSIASHDATAAALVARRGRAGLSRAELPIVTGNADASGLASVGDWLVAPKEVDLAAERMGKALDAYHAAEPLSAGMSIQAWRATSGGSENLATLAESQLLRSGFERSGSVVRRVGFSPGGSAADRSALERIYAALVAADAEPPLPAELAASNPGLNVTALLGLLVREGRVIRVADRYYVTDALARERQRLEEALRHLGPATPAAIRDHIGRSRKWLIPLLEWADQEGFTVRDGNVRKLNLQAGA